MKTRANKSRRPKREVAPRDAMPLVLYCVTGAAAGELDGQPACFGYRTVDGLDHGARVGVYELREVRTLHVTRGLR